MKTQHWIILVLAIAIAGGLLLWPKTHTEDTAINELIGQWQAGGMNADGFEWSMTYTFETDGTYTLTTGTDYAEEGAYTIATRYLDGSFEVHKLFQEGEKEYTMVLVPTENPDVLGLEGIELTRVTP